MAGTDPAFPPPGSSSARKTPGATPSVIIDGADPLLGLNLSGFIVSRLIASGGMGLVYLAEHETIGRRAAVKVLKPEVAGDTEWTRRFLTEARALASLKHRNLIEVLNFGKTPDGRQFLMMEFLEGESLDAHIKRVGALTPAVALGIADQVLNGLAEAHKKGIVHRDLKPSNVFLLREHNGELLIKVIDFGLARQEPIALVDAPLPLPVSKEGASLLAGTPEYIAPEQAQGLKVDGAADLYSLGVMLYEMLTGKLPFESPSVARLLQKHLSERPPALSLTLGSLVEGLEEFVDALLEKDPGKRPSSADVARVTVARLQRRLAAEATGLRPLPSGPRHEPTQRIERRPTPSRLTDESLEKAFPGYKARRRRFAWFAVLLLLLLGVGAWWGVKGRQPAVAAETAVVAAPAPSAAMTAPPPPVAAPVAPAVPEPVAEAAEDVAPEDDLAPIPTNLKPGVTARSKARKVKVKFSVDVAKCEVSDEWRSRIKHELATLGTLAAQKDKMATYEQYEPTIQTYSSATSPSECVKINGALNLLSDALGAATTE